MHSNYNIYIAIMRVNTPGFHGTLQYWKDNCRGTPVRPYFSLLLPNIWQSFTFVNFF